LVAAGEPDLGLDQQSPGELLDLRAPLGLLEAFQHAQVQLGDQLPVELLLEGLIAIGLGFRGAYGEKRRRIGARAVGAPKAVTEVHGLIPFQRSADAPDASREPPRPALRCSPTAPACAPARRYRARRGCRRGHRTAACRR